MSREPGPLLKRLAGPYRRERTARRALVAAAHRDGPVWLARDAGAWWVVTVDVTAVWDIASSSSTDLYKALRRQAGAQS